MMLYSYGGDRCDNIWSWKKYPLGNVREGVIIEIFDNGFSIVIGLRGIKEYEVKAFSSGKIRLDLSFVNNLVFIILEIHELLNVSDAPFPISGIKNEFQQLISHIKDSSVVQFFLVDTDESIIKAMRMISVSKEFIDLLTLLLEKQMEEGITREAYNKNLSRVYENLSPRDLRRLAIMSSETID